jgi:hypothetical protein
VARGRATPPKFEGLGGTSREFGAHGSHLEPRLRLEPGARGAWLTVEPRARNSRDLEGLRRNSRPTAPGSSRGLSILLYYLDPPVQATKTAVQSKVTLWHVIFRFVILRHIHHTRAASLQKSVDSVAPGLHSVRIKISPDNLLFLKRIFYCFIGKLNFCKHSSQSSILYDIFVSKTLFGMLQMEFNASENISRSSFSYKTFSTAGRAGSNLFNTFT